MRSWLAIRLAAIALAISLAGQTSAEDRIVIAPPESRGEIIIRGDIVDFLGSTIRIRAAGSDEVRVVPVGQIVRIETSYLAEHRTALVLLGARETQAAEEAFLEAYESEPRAWVKREILAQLVQCAQRREDHLTAATRFLEIVEDDPQSRFWGQAAIPWMPTAVTEPLRDQARLWLQRSSDSDRFLGACWLLLDDRDHDSAEAVLRELSRGTNIRVAGLATAQLWRIRLRAGNTTDIELADWRGHIEFLPRESRSGPQALLASAYQRTGHYEQAAAEWLWISTVYSEQAALTAKATFEAGECLFQLGRHDEATTLFTESLERFAWSPEAGLARQRLQEIEAASGPMID